ncbi:hypothetical protein APHAL10511_000948 [Amanita phalloides]|nr:hypothetical protein APHAL10511_000948 [Amanita phalloides]
MVDGPPGLITAGNRLNRLLEYQARWRNCEWTSLRSLPFPILLGHDDVESNDDGYLTRGTISAAFLFLNSHFRFIQWISHVQGLEHLEWDIRPPQLNRMIDIDFDVHQDLLILLEIPEDDGDATRLSVSRLNDGLQHPLASTTPLVTYGSHAATQIRIYGPYVTAFTGAQFSLECRFSVYDWKTGVHLLTLWKHWIEAMTFISNQYALLIELDRLSAQFCLWIVDVHRPTNRYVCSLHLPKLGPGMRMTSHVNVQSGPHSSPHDIHPESCPIFTTDPGYRLVLVTFSVCRNEAFGLFTLASNLEKLAEKYQGDESPASIPWEQWGPENTRIIEITQGAGENPCVYGTRAIITHADTQLVYDFNQRSIMRKLSRHESGEEPDNIVTAATELTGRETFVGRVTTSLPYRFTNAGLDIADLDETILHMGENSIICVPHDSSQHITALSI